MKNPRLVEAIKEMDDARRSDWSARWSAGWSARSAVWSAIDSAEVSRKEVLEILKMKLTAKEQKK